MATGQTVGYTRVSSVEQNLARQLGGIKLDRVFEDKAPSKDVKRPAQVALQAFVGEGDKAMVHSIDRLARNLVDFRAIISGLNDNGVTVTFVKENLTFSADTSSPMKTLMLSMMGAFAEFERSMILGLQREGIAAAKAAANWTARTLEASRCGSDQDALCSIGKQGSPSSRVQGVEEHTVGCPERLMTQQQIC